MQQCAWEKPVPGSGTWLQGMSEQLKAKQITDHLKE
jgi:hypothetical protein